jgi:protein gp37
MDLDWVRDIDRQCLEAGVPHFFKQAYVGGGGQICEEPVLDGSVVQELPLSPGASLFRQFSANAARESAP